MELFECDIKFDSIVDSDPVQIEKRSMELIDEELRLRLGEGYKAIARENLPVVRRCVHTSADFDYAQNLYFSNNAVKIARRLIREEKPVVITDTNMAFSGINRAARKKYGVDAMCFVADSDVKECSARTGFTRSLCAVDKAAHMFAKKEGVKKKVVIYACGNAPTALLRIRQLSDAGIFKPDFVVAAAVGFVNVTQAKQLIIDSAIPCIVTKGNKGGSAIAACIVNALFYM